MVVQFPGSGQILVNLQYIINFIILLTWSVDSNYLLCFTNCMPGQPILKCTHSHRKEIKIDESKIIRLFKQDTIRHFNILFHTIWKCFEKRNFIVFREQGIMDWYALSAQSCVWLTMKFIWTCLDIYRNIHQVKVSWIAWILYSSVVRVWSFIQFIFYLFWELYLW